MAVSETVERSVRLRGPCSSWFPVVRDSLSAHGCRLVAEESPHRLSAAFGDAPVSGSVSVSLSPAPSCGTDVAVAVTTIIGGGQTHGPF